MYDSRVVVVCRGPRRTAEAEAEAEVEVQMQACCSFAAWVGGLS